MYSSAGVNSGFGMLLLVSVAGGALLSPGKIGILYAAIASIAVLSHEAYMQFYIASISPSYTHAGFLGVGFFSTALLGQLLASRVEESEALAEQISADFEKLDQINETIVQRLKSGIIVLDEKSKIQLINESASMVFMLDHTVTDQYLIDVIPELGQIFEKWELSQGNATINLRVSVTNNELQASFIRLDSHGDKQYLIYLDDVTQLRQSAQQMKLASLGRLTASIAHEIRNPLGAISHAGQLLSESESIPESDRRLTDIIDEQSKRMNRIVENIMGISRADQAQPVVLNLNEWLDEFKQEFVRDKQLDDEDILLQKRDAKIMVNIDPTQLRQILINLIENGIRYSHGTPRIELVFDELPDSQRPFLDIIDTGSGIDEDSCEHLFEPFFTTESSGTGLGLYIARELCEANQAILSLFSTSNSGSCFRIAFPHIDKQHNII
jgi:two-component system sensor histidine kinase PilS (NtrC family)